MQVIRSFPATIPHGRSYVVDNAIRNVNDAYSYRALPSFGDDLIHLDWDMAVGREDLEHFAAHARRDPGRPLVGPQRVDVGDGRRHLTAPLWNMRSYIGPGLRHVQTGESTCDLFGFGLVYLPGKLLHEFEDRFRDELDDGSVRFDDTGFSGWVSRTLGPSPICWDVHPVHLHYEIGQVAL